MSRWAADGLRPGQRSGQRSRWAADGLRAGQRSDEIVLAAKDVKIGQKSVKGQLRSGEVTLVDNLRADKTNSAYIRHGDMPAATI